MATDAKGVIIMTNIKINGKNRTIELTNKKFADAASCFGSDEYKELQEARRDYPTFRVVTKFARAKASDHNKGLTYAYMERYIMAHDDENGSIMAEYKTLRGTSDEAVELGTGSASYNDVKKWFDSAFPAFAEFQKKREAILLKVAANKKSA